MSTRVAHIRERLALVEEGIARALRGVSGPERVVETVVVTKGQPVEVIRDAICAGARLFGENYPDESESKIRALQDEPDLTWHMIGHLQSRKAGIVAAHFHMLESLDRLSLAEKLERRLAEADRFLPVLLEVNAAGEASKSGWRVDRSQDWDAFAAEVEMILAMPHLRVQGLMTMPPLFADAEGGRPYFARVARVRDFLAQRFPQASWEALSMGTSADYPVAVQEGATLVRIGTAILGPRPPRQA